MSQGTVETLEFQAEARKLLHLVVHSIYSHKDIFLRELLSNASDAMDKLRLEALTRPELGVDPSQLHIQLIPDPAARTLTLVDQGIGMSRTEVKELLGTIARSGTAEFLQKLKEAQASAAPSEELIGQFGVGFYSSFMVADRVVLETRKAGEEAGTRWESTGEGSFSLQEIERASPGTSVTLHLKPVDEEDGIQDYTEEWVLRDLVKRYSDFLAWPIRMEVERKDGEETRLETVTLNSQKALWARDPGEVAEEEYRELYKHISHDWNDPLKTIPMKGEGTFEFQALLFLPSKAPMDLYHRDGRRGVQLYVKRVFIMDRCEELLPEYLRFVRGVVDAQDLSLNVSRELLQQDRQIRAIRKGLTRKILSTLEEIQEREPETYLTFWKEFGRVLKEGLFQDPAQQENLLRLCLLPSTHGEELTRLSDYVARMKEGQEAIYYLVGEHRGALESSPHLEAFRARGYEVLLLGDSVDAIWVESAMEFEGRRFQSAARGDLTLDSEDQGRLEAQRKELATLVAWMASKLSDQVKEVRLTSRLTQSPACLVSDQHDPSPTMEKLMKAMGQDLPPVKRILELNPDHPVIQRLQEVYGERQDDPALAEALEVLHGQALLAEGGEVTDPARFARLLGGLLTRALA